MRILEVFEPPTGGVADIVCRLTLELHARGHEVEAIGPLETPVWSSLEEAGVPIEPLDLRPGFRLSRRDVRVLRRLRQRLRERDWDAVHLHSTRAGALGRLAARGTGVPVVFSPHSFSFVGPWGALRRGVSLSLERALARRTAVILCVCEEERRIAQAQRLRPQSFAVVHNGVPPCADVEPDPGLLALRGAGPLVASVCELRPQKDVGTFVRAAGLLLPQAPGATFAAVGNGPDRAEIERQAEPLGPRLRLLGFQAPSARYLRAADVYVLPSRWEAFPVAVLEAMACGLPVVATDVGGTGEALEDGVTGMLVPSEDPAALARAVGELIADPALRERMGRAGRARVEARFTVEHMVSGTEAAYRQAAGRRS